VDNAEKTGKYLMVMKKKLFAMVLATMLSGLSSCIPEKNRLQIITVKFEGKAQDSLATDERNAVEDFANVFLIKYLSDENGQISLPACEFDLLAITDNIFSKASLYYEYDPGDGHDLEFLISDSISFLNGNPLSIYYNGSLQAEHFINALTDDEIKHLAYLYMELDTVPGKLSQIDRVARLNPRVKIISNEMAAKAALDRFDPEFLFVADDNCCDSAVIGQISSEESIQRLALLNCSGSDLDMILKLPDLRKLVIHNIEDFDLKQPLTVNSSLEILYINGAFSDIEFFNLDFLASFKNLKQIAIIGNDTSLDISYLEGLKKLESVNLLWSAVSGLGPLKGNRSLERIYFPGNISQNDFNEFISDHPELNFISLFGSEEVSDFSPLLELKNLEYLMIQGIDSSFTAGSLKGLNHLKYLSIGPVKDSTLLPEIRAILPGTIINENTGVCLGSGYLLLLIPLVLFISIFSMIYRKRIS
jgi:hypothetical protein